LPELHVILDSTVRVNADFWARNPRLHIVQLTVKVGEREWPEEEVSCEQLFRAVQATGIAPKTSQPSVGAFLQVLTPLAAAGHSILIIALSGGLSGTVQGAATAAQMLPEARVETVDSGTTSFGMQWMAEAALNLADQGLTLSEVARKVRAMAQATYTLFIPDTLDYLHKGGRIGGAARLIGNILQIKPVLYLVDGKVQVLDKVRTRSRAIERILDEVSQYNDLVYACSAGIGGPGGRDPIAAPAARRLANVPLYGGEISPVIASHVGPGTIGMIFQRKVAP
jgi:DegV family protein with EDD domain